MKVISLAEALSGFLCDEPFDDLTALTHCGEALANTGAELPPHQHRGFEFLYLVRGSVGWKIGETLIHQQMGDLFIVPPLEIHGTANKFNKNTFNLWIGLELDKLGPEGIHLAQRLRQKRIHLLHHCHGVEPVLRAIVGAVVTPLPNQRKVILAYLTVLFALIEQGLSMARAPKESAVKTHLPYSYPVQKAIFHMRRNLNCRLSLSELAKAASMRNTSYFGFRFRQEVGATPAAYHLQLRLDAAHDCLRQPSMDITSVALQYGFSSSQHFSALFRRAFGVTPLAWKKNQAH